MAKTQAQLEDEIKSVYEQIEEYKRKYHEEVELKREREEELRKKEGQAAGAGTLASSTSGSSTTTTSSAAAAPASPWRAAVRLGGSPSVSSNSSPSSSTSTTPHASGDSVPTRRPLSKNEEELKKDKKDKKDKKERKEKKEKKKHNKSLTRHHSSDAVPTTAFKEPSLSVGGEGSAAAAATAVAEKTFTVRSLQAHKATSKNELSFAKGVIITVIEENKADDLFKGQIGKKEGWFPSFYVVRT